MQEYTPFVLPLVGGARLPDQVEYITLVNKDAIQLIVGCDDRPTGIRKFIVSRPHVMSLSERWRVTIKQQSSKNIFGVQKVKHVLLPEDDAEMIRLLMLMAHFQAAKLPSRLDLDELVRLAQVVERYDVSHMILPYLTWWLNPHRENMLMPGYEQWLYLNYHFGFEEDYLLLADHLLVHCGVDKNSDLVWPNGNLVVGILPTNALYIIKQCRLNVITKMLEITDTLLTEMRLLNHCRIPEAGPRSKTMCTALNKLRIERYLTAHGVMKALHDPSRIYISPQDLMKLLLDAAIVETTPPPSMTTAQPLGAGTSLNPYYDHLHDNCSVEEKFKARLDQVMASRQLGADRMMMDVIREHARRYGRAPFYGYDTERLFVCGNSMDEEWAARIVSPTPSHRARRDMAGRAEVDSISSDREIFRYNGLSQ